MQTTDADRTGQRDDRVRSATRPFESDKRDAQLIAAAEALKTWVNGRRATWPQRPATPAAAARSRQDGAALSPAPSGVTAAPPVGASTAPLSIFASPAPEVDESAPQTEHVTGDRRGFPQWASRAAIAAAVVAIVGVTGWKVVTLPRNGASVPSKGTAVLESVPTGSPVFVDGVEAGATPLLMELTPGRHAIEFHRRGGTRSLNVEVVAGQSVVGRLDWVIKRPGTLEVLSDPEGAAVIVDDDVLGVTPLIVDDLKPGSHRVVLTGLRGSIQRTVEITPDRAAQVTDAVRSGWMHVSTPIELDVTEGSRTIQLDEQNQVLLPAGVHDLKFENAELGYHDRRRVDVKVGAITPISVVPPGAPLTVTATLPSDVYLDGQRLGSAPITNHYVDLGPHVVMVRSITGPERRLPLTITVNPSRLNVDFSQP